MKAMMLSDGAFRLQDVPDPAREAGQILTRPLACGVCGSDLHARDHADHLCDLLHRAGFRGFMDPRQPVVMGHEFCCEVLEGDGIFARGQRVVALPFIQGAQGVELIGYSNRFNGAFAEQMLLQTAAAFAVPDAVETEIAALTEPLSVAVHAVAEAGADKECGFAVIGCGPVGLFVIARLRALGLGPILAIEPNPARQAMAARMGADTVLAPGDVASEGWWNDLGLPLGLSDAMAQAPELRQRKRAILFDCVGKPGMLMAIGQAAPVGATIVVIGTCMETDAIEPAFLLQKGLRVQFVFAYTPTDFADAFAMICADPARMAPMVTGHVGFAGVERAFGALSAGGSDVKLMVSPT
ncbi:zinc-binding dehydrogenase [Sphingobium boeckii]|uniref:Threonine dehydrogenase-like Zn-dependent dehydrogenase n=1 Tax=Sphingobium boeckii TaxID=1082345 RepID=A0A7W9AHN6_9SPHN|nr:zinc-binding dehydrogenase [Sphingobium boeckii]MBB5685870.1 threonine dehydrogenase-like Zn-dependent dehydrogenase [Sphingobium boeckii]